MAVQHKISYWLRLLLLGLAVSVSQLACAGAPGQLDAPAESATQPPAQFQHGLASPADNLEQLTSYRADYVIGYAGSRAGQPVNGQIELQTDVDRLHQATRTAQNIESPNLAGQPIELVRLPNATVLKQGDDLSWFRVANDRGIDPVDMGILAGLENLVVLPSVVSSPPVFETWQGRNVQKYVFTAQDLNTPAIDFTGAQGEMRVDVDGNFLVQYALTATIAAQSVAPAADLFDSGQLTLTYSLSHPNALTISVPEDDRPLVSNSLTALPRPIDAELTAIYPTLLEYTSAITPISATLYFGSQLPPLGWTQTITGVFVEKARLAFNRDHEDITVLVAPQPDSSRNKVTVSLVTRP